jgi:hypothetical protein
MAINISQAFKNAEINFSAEIRLDVRDKNIIEDIITKFCVVEGLTHSSRENG